MSALYRYDPYELSSARCYYTTRRGSDMRSTGGEGSGSGGETICPKSDRAETTSPQNSATLTPPYFGAQQYYSTFDTSAVEEEQYYGDEDGDYLHYGNYHVDQQEAYWGAESEVGYFPSSSAYTPHAFYDTSYHHDSTLPSTPTTVLSSVGGGTTNFPSTVSSTIDHNGGRHCLPNGRTVRHKYPSLGNFCGEALDDGAETVLPLFEQPPEGTLHSVLVGSLNFCCYPTAAFENLEATLPKEEMTRMFIGQLPKNVTEMQLGWLAYTFGGGANLYHFERITKKNKNKNHTKEIPTGCFHCWVDPKDVATLTSGLHKKVLVDDTGIWYCGGDPAVHWKTPGAYAESEEEAVELQRCRLEQYCDCLKLENDRLMSAGSGAVGALPAGRPFGTVVVQPATSTYGLDPSE